MRQDLPATPARMLIRALGLHLRTTAMVEDLYSRPIVRTLVAQPKPAEEEREAA